MKKGPNAQALGGHPTGVGSFPWRAQRAAARNSNRFKTPQLAKFPRLFKILFWVGIIYFCLHLFHLDVWKIFDSIRENEHVLSSHLVTNLFNMNSPWNTILSNSNIQSIQTLKRHGLSWKGITTFANHIAVQKFPHAIGLMRNGYHVYTLLSPTGSVTACVLGVAITGYVHRDKLVDPRWQANQLLKIHQVFIPIEELVQSAPGVLEDVQRQVNLAVERIPIAEYTNSVGIMGQRLLSDQARESFKVHAAEKINRLKNVPIGDIVNTVKNVSQRTVVHMVGDVAGLMRGFPGALKNLGAGTV
ncbi:hypothetical protein M231_03729 [Tremella mesenterica]|uniref:Uncharacterized protein n=1 Tax=Tremella mesenterica TaxID=5217 RepID=A0A4Q1BME4_TREME|nr:hypothetical protein M231_03729 [Tremella mesenterica]